MNYGVLKLDISKAYDRVTWPFYRQVLMRMNVPEQWSFKILINGWEFESFKPTRGLRQGQWWNQKNLKRGAKFNDKFWWAVRLELGRERECFKNFRKEWAIGGGRVC